MKENEFIVNEKGARTHYGLDVVDNKCERLFMYGIT